MRKLLDVIEDLDDTQDVYHNARVVRSADHERPGWSVAGGRRARCLAWKLARRSARRGANGATWPQAMAGTSAGSRAWRTCPSPDTKAAVRHWARATRSGLTVVGPEAPLAAGVVDEFRAHAACASSAPAELAGPAGEFQGLFQGLHAAPRISHGGLMPTLLDAARGPCLSCGSGVRPSW